MDLSVVKFSFDYNISKARDGGLMKLQNLRRLTIVTNSVFVA